MLFCFSKCIRIYVHTDLLQLTIDFQGLGLCKYICVCVKQKVILYSACYFMDVMKLCILLLAPWAGYPGDDQRSQRVLMGTVPPSGFCVRPWGQTVRAWGHKGKYSLIRHWMIFQLGASWPQKSVSFFKQIIPMFPAKGRHRLPAMMGESSLIRLALLWSQSWLNEPLLCDSGSNRPMVLAPSDH